jgi:FtsH-binding integral membrane protein
MDAAQRGRDILGERALDLADEAQGDVELRVALPAGAGDAAHQREQAFPDKGRRAEADEQAVHDADRLTLNRGRGKPVLLVLPRWNTDIPPIRQLCRAKEFKMANWSDPRPGAPYATQTGARSDAIDAGLRSYMLSIYNYMASAVLLTGIVALLFSQTSLMQVLVNFNLAGRPTGMTGLGWIVTLAPIGIVLAMSFGQNRMSTGTLQVLFWSYALLMGASLSTLFLAYTDASIAQCFFATAAGFAGLSLFGYTTKRNLGPLGAFLVMGVFGLIGAMILNLLIFQSSSFDLIISAVGVLIFAGLTAYDTQKLKNMYDYVRGTDMMGKVVIMGALTLYLDFINMFLFLLRLFGSSRD